MAKYQKKRKEPNFIFKFEDGEPTKEECVADMAKVFFLLWEAQKRGLKKCVKILKNSENQNLKKKSLKTI